jgi:hypothetical protein
MHICPDEIKAIGAVIGAFGTIGFACRYCWYKVTFWRKKP